MKERRKIFSAADLAAIKDGRKTMFREMVVPQPPADIDRLHGGKLRSRAPYVLRDDNDNPCGFGFQDDQGNYWTPPLGTVGDRLWLPEAHQFLRETCSYEYEEYDLFEWERDLYGSPKDHLLAKCPRGGHRAVIGCAGEEDMEDQEMRPSITMPRWACRTFAEITGVRVERVGDITEEDAKAEGVVESEIGRLASRTIANYKAIHRAPLVLQFADLWQSRHGNWDANPWVWAYSIKLIKP